MKVKKTVVASLLSIFLLGGAIPIYAVNNSETYYKFNFTKFYSVKYTDGRKKMTSQNHI